MSHHPRPIFTDEEYKSFENEEAGLETAITKLKKPTPVSTKKSKQTKSVSPSIKLDGNKKLGKNEAFKFIVEENS